MRTPRSSVYSHHADWCFISFSVGAECQREKSHDGHRLRHSCLTWEISNSITKERKSGVEFCFDNILLPFSRILLNTTDWIFFYFIPSSYSNRSLELKRGIYQSRIKQQFYADITLNPPASFICKASISSISASFSQFFQRKRKKNCSRFSLLSPKQKHFCHSKSRAQRREDGGAGEVTQVEAKHNSSFFFFFF